MKPTLSKENYLEAILFLSENNDYVKSVHLAVYLGYSKPSVSIALKKLTKDKLVEITKEKNIILTEVGYQLACELNKRHNIVKALLIHIGVKKEMAEKEACAIEHVISLHTCNIIKQFLKKQNLKIDLESLLS